MRVNVVARAPQIFARSKGGPRRKKERGEERKKKFRPGTSDAGGNVGKNYYQKITSKFSCIRCDEKSSKTRSEKKGGRMKRGFSKSRDTANEEKPRWPQGCSPTMQLIVDARLFPH